MRNDENVIYSEKPKNMEAISKATFYARVFLYFGISLLLTAGLTIGLTYLFNSIWPIASTGSRIAYFTITIISAIGVVVSSVNATFRSLAKSQGGIVSWLFYVLFMSFLLSTIGYYIEDLNLVGIAVLITSGMFLVMCIFGLILRDKVSWLWLIAIGLLSGAGIICMVNFFLIPILYVSSGNLSAVRQMYYIVDFIILIYGLIITAIDMWNIKKFAQTAQDNTNVALYFALNLYNDYILILLKVIVILLRSSRD